MNKILLKSKSFLTQLGVEPGDDETVILQKNTYVYTSLVGVSGLVCWSIPMLWFGEKGAGFTWLGYAAFLLLTLIFWAVSRRGFQFAGYSFILSLLVFPLFLSFQIGTFTGFGGAWYVILATIAAYVYFPNRFNLFLLFAIITLISGLLWEANHRPSVLFPPAFFAILYGGSFITLGGITVVMLISILKQRNLAYHILSLEQKKSEDLLLNILPKEISIRLKSNTGVIADQLDQVSVLFADIVNFTPLAAQMTPIELVEMLNELFSIFDAIAEKYNLEKIKTIGDCYMAAAGVPMPREDHAIAITQMAIEMRNQVANFSFKGKKIAIRIGIHSGELVAGVIGKKKFAYDLWGDTVNTASRMESHGSENNIQITRSTFELISHQFQCTSVGTIYVKGKGEVEAWLVQGFLNPETA